MVNIWFMDLDVVPSGDRVSHYIKFIVSNFKFQCERDFFLGLTNFS